eukprot:gnl/TRDRNA2_/TRDRNA2_191386_c0_seq1.p1 gnl/TRDRNA2_/TRDRNA2_191386_c0~~gnl/TRDRNA2_/TRDRNA2_191386_c0_seq1.p1  ORF type:complete len:372 (-),score=55.55 gnl/TRDRNA2_/TRDRNA2_191386_c0_seq1:51-1166(-)
MDMQWPGILCNGCSCEDELAQERRRGNTRCQLPYDFEEEVALPSRAPKVRGFPTYSSAPDQPLLGVPIREGGLWHLSTQDRFEPVQFSLYVNGFAFSTNDGLEASISLSPFSLVRNCRFQSGACAQLKSFKVSLLDHDPCCYFAVRSLCEREAEEERSEWVLSISHTILLITDSLLPCFSVTCDPLVGVSWTGRRLMAGYLIHRDDAGSVSVLFCELHGHSGDSAKFVIYENELCQSPIMDLLVTEVSVCCDIVGINCSCFVIDTHHFASQTPSERKLWLRALSNVKVKLQNRAPSPNAEGLEHYRDAIREHIRAVEAVASSRISTDPLLGRAPRKAMHTVGDGDTEPAVAMPMEEFGGSMSATARNHVSL